MRSFDGSIRAGPRTCSGRLYCLCVNRTDVQEGFFPCEGSKFASERRIVADFGGKPQLIIAWDKFDAMGLTEGKDPGDRTDVPSLYAAC